MRSLSTGEVAKITQSSVQSVIRWIDTGMLKAWRVPGSRFRRVEEGNLRAFMARHNIPLEYLEATSKRVLVVSNNQLLRTVLAPLRLHGLAVTCVPPFEAGMRLVDTPTAAVAIDEALGDSTVQGIVATLNARSGAIPSTTIAVDALDVGADNGHPVSSDVVREYFTHRLRDLLRDQS